MHDGIYIFCSLVCISFYQNLSKGMSHQVGGNRNVNTIDERRSKIVRNRVSDCHVSPVSPDWRQMTIENTVSSDF